MPRAAAIFPQRRAVAARAGPVVGRTITRAWCARSVQVPARASTHALQLPARRRRARRSGKRSCHNVQRNARCWRATLLPLTTRPARSRADSDDCTTGREIRCHTAVLCTSTCLLSIGEMMIRLASTPTTSALSTTPRSKHHPARRPRGVPQHTPSTGAREVRCAGATRSTALCSGRGRAYNVRAGGSLPHAQTAPVSGTRLAAAAYEHHSLCHLPQRSARPVRVGQLPLAAWHRPLPAV